MKMESGSKWRQNPSDVSDESDKGGSGKRGGAVSQTGSWRRGMSAQVGVTTPRTKSTTVTSGPGMMKTHGTGRCALVTLLHWPSLDCIQNMRKHSICPSLLDLNVRTL